MKVLFAPGARLGKIVTKDALHASKQLPGSLEECSLKAGWSSLLLRRYREPAVVDPFETAATDCQLIVLIKSGTTRIESFRAGRWLHESYFPGDLGLTPAGQTSRLRWEGRERHTTLQLHLPDKTIAAAANELQVRASSISDRLNALSARDSLVQHAMLALASGAENGLPDLYAEGIAHMLALHLVAQAKSEPRYGQRDDVILQRLDAYMRANLANPLSLVEIAGHVERSPFQVIRLTKRFWGETPFVHLTRLRMEHARELLGQHRSSTLAVALQCGYGNPAHFALAFRRATGMSPSRYRTTCQR